MNIRQELHTRRTWKEFKERGDDRIYYGKTGPGQKGISEKYDVIIAKGGG